MRDESLDFVCDELERLVFAVVHGRFSQRVQGRWLVTPSPGGHSRSRLTAASENVSEAHCSTSTGSLAQAGLSHAAESYREHHALQW